MNCLNCNSETTNRKFCSHSCSVSMQQKLRNSNIPIPTKICPQCKLKFEVGKRSTPKRSSQVKFCSRKCAAQHNHKNRKTKLTPKTKDGCIGCNGQVTGRARFCASCLKNIPTKERKRLWSAEEKERLTAMRVPPSFDRSRMYNLKYNYGLTNEQVLSAFEDDNGSCHICGHRPAADAKGHHRLHLDHDHESGKVRGWLCMSCNTALGHFKDDIDRLRQAVAYLERHEHE